MRARSTNVLSALACRVQFHSDKPVKWRPFLPPETFPPGTVRCSNRRMICEFAMDNLWVEDRSGFPPAETQSAFHDRILAYSNSEGEMLKKEFSTVVAAARCGNRCPCLHERILPLWT